MQRIAIGRRVDRDGSQPQFTAGSNNPHRDLATVRYQDFFHPSPSPPEEEALRACAAKLFDYK